MLRAISGDDQRGGLQIVQRQPADPAVFVRVSVQHAARDAEGLRIVRKRKPRRLAGLLAPGNLIDVGLSGHIADVFGNIQVHFPTIGRVFRRNGELIVPQIEQNKPGLHVFQYIAGDHQIVAVGRHRHGIEHLIIFLHLPRLGVQHGQMRPALLLFLIDIAKIRPRHGIVVQQAVNFKRILRRLFAGKVIGENPRALLLRVDVNPVPAIKRLVDFAAGNDRLKIALFVPGVNSIVSHIQNLFPRGKERLDAVVRRLASALRHRRGAQENTGNEYGKQSLHSSLSPS